MTTTVAAAQPLPTPETESISAALIPIVAAIGAQAPARESQSHSPEPEVAALAAAGLGRLRVPVEFGGGGSSVSELASELIRLAAADSNFVQIFRGHLGFVEFLLRLDASPVRDELLAAAGRGELFGPAASVSASGKPGEAAPTTIIDSSTTLERGENTLVLSGSKYYTTGSLYAQWINVLVINDDGVFEVVVGRNDPGVGVIDDWNGFGQRFTASGTAHFDRVEVRPGYALRRESAATGEYLNAFYQLVHSSTQAGILERATRDLGELVAGRTRSYPLATATPPRHDPQVLEVVGEVETAAYGTRSAVTAAALTVDGYNADPSPQGLNEVIVAAAATQVLNTRLAGEATWRFFDAASASATDLDLALDRHWRNARTISSHNPVIYKARSIGEYLVNGELPSSFGTIIAPRE